MTLKEDNIDIYNNSAIILNNKTPNFIINWIIILILLSLLICIILFIPFNIYKQFNGYIILKDNNSYINLIVNKNDFPLYKNKKLFIEKEKYKYKIISIDDNNTIIKINLKEDIKINNNIVNVSILKDRTILYKIIKNKIKKGFGL